MGKVAKIVLQVAAVLALIAVVLRLLLFEAWVVPAEDRYLAASVAPTLAGGDSVLLLTRGEPGFGDLVRCKDPEAPTRWVVGRIAGIAGNVVQLHGRVLIVDGKRYDTSEACDEPHFKVKHPDTGSEIDGDCGRVEMAGGWHFVGSSPKGPSTDDRKHTVGPGMFFLVSDNRDVHDDSRDFGSVPVEYCQERVVFRFWGAEGFGDSKSRFAVIR